MGLKRIKTDIKQHYFKETMKQWLWGFFDNFFRIIAVSLLWFLLNAPVILTAFIFIYRKVYNPFIYVVVETRVLVRRELDVLPLGFCL